MRPHGLPRNGAAPRGLRSSSSPLSATRSPERLELDPRKCHHAEVTEVVDAKIYPDERRPPRTAPGGTVTLRLSTCKWRRTLAVQRAATMTFRARRALETDEATAQICSSSSERFPPTPTRLNCYLGGGIVPQKPGHKSDRDAMGFEAARRERRSAVGSCLRDNLRDGKP